MSRSIRPVDLHSHSIFSDGRANIFQIEEKCLKDNFSIVLTDHNEIRGSIKLFERNRIVTLPALEAGTKEGLEFLIYFKSVVDIESFYKKIIEPYKRERFMVQIGIPAEALIKTAREYECFISLAHPYGFRKKSLKYHLSNKNLIFFILNNIDAVETYNGNLSEYNNIRSKLLFDSVSALNSTVGSDGHDLDSLGQVTADFELSNEDFNTFGLFQALKTGDYSENTANKISKINTALNISYFHTLYYFDKGNSVERRIKSDKNNM